MRSPKRRHVISPSIAELACSPELYQRSRCLTDSNRAFELKALYGWARSFPPARLAAGVVGVDDTIEGHFARKQCQTFSAGLRSGARKGSSIVRC